MLRSALVTALSAIVAITNAQDVPSLEDVLTKNKNLTTFNELLQQHYPDFLSVLSAQQADIQPITVLVPSNDAFSKIPNSAIGVAFKDNNTDAIRQVLQYHVLPGNHPTNTFSTSFQFFPTWMSDQQYTNVSSGQRVGVVEQTPEYVFVSGIGTRSTVTQPDIAFTGGVLHVIDMPVIPPASYPETAEDYNITAFLGSNYQNLTLATLMNLTSDITIFAPNNDAYQSIASSPILLDNSSLSSLTQYHIVFSPSGPLYTTLLTNGSVFPALQGNNLTIRQEGNNLYINSAQLLTSDLLLANGVMHIIDNVMDPNASDAQPNPQLATQAPILPQGTTTALGILPFTSAVPDVTMTASSSTTSSSSSGAAAASTDGGLSAASSTDSGLQPSTTKKSDAAATFRYFRSTTGSGLLSSLLLFFVSAVCALVMM